MSDLVKNYTVQFLSKRHELMAFIFGLLRDPVEAEEVFQEVWVKLAETAQRGEQINAVDKWSRGVARNLILHRWRDRGEKHKKVYLDQELLDAAALAFDEQAVEQNNLLERRHALGQCVHGLPKPSRELLRLRYEQGQSLVEVAKETGRTAPGVGMALSRLRRDLADCMKRKLAGGDQGA